MMQSLLLILHVIFEGTIITSSICFLEIISILHCTYVRNCIKPTVHSIRNFDCRKIGLHCLVNW